VEIPVIQNGANCGKSGHRFWVFLQDRGKRQSATKVRPIRRKWDAFHGSHQEVGRGPITEFVRRHFVVEYIFEVRGVEGVIDGWGQSRFFSNGASFARGV